MISALLSIFAAFIAWFGVLFGTPATYIAPVLIAQQRPHATILFGGDMMFDRSIRTAVGSKGGDFLFSCIDQTLSSADAVVANLEGPITSTSSRSVGSSPGDSNNFTFTFPTSTALLLARHGIKVVNLGNNHIENFGIGGERETMRWLDAAGVHYFGDTIEQRVATSTINGITFVFINYNQFSDSSNASTTVAQIKSARARGALPVVYTHWGTEYVPAMPLEKTLAHQFVDAGAAVVIGSHPHVIQEHEMYKGKPIYYSLGNFIFDQYFSDAVRTGILVRVAFDSSGVQGIEEIPIELMRDRTTCPRTPLSTPQ